MTTFYSDQRTNERATPPTKQDPSEAGRLFVKHFTFTGDVAQNDLVELCLLPAGARVYHGRVDFTDFGSSVTMDIGTSTDEDHWAAAIDVATAAGQADFANTHALYGLGREALTAATMVIAKFEAANPDSGTIRGYVMYAGPA